MKKLILASSLFLSLVAFGHATENNTVEDFTLTAVNLSNNESVTVAFASEEAMLNYLNSEIIFSGLNILKEDECTMEGTVTVGVVEVSLKMTGNCDGMAKRFAARVSELKDELTESSAWESFTDWLFSW